jgi:hypothetical protein
MQMKLKNTASYVYTTVIMYLNTDMGPCIAGTLVRGGDSFGRGGAYQITKSEITSKIKKMKYPNGYIIIIIVFCLAPAYV